MLEMGATWIAYKEMVIIYKFTIPLVQQLETYLSFFVSFILLEFLLFLLNHVCLMGQWVRVFPISKHLCLGVYIKTFRTRCYAIFYLNPLFFFSSYFKIYYFMNGSLLFPLHIYTHYIPSFSLLLDEGLIKSFKSQ